MLEKESFVCDRHVLETLRLWRFREHKRKTHASSPGSNGPVLSDTLGASRTRSGKIVVAASTARFPSVFALFARWLQCHHPGSLSARFPFTSVDLNYAYATALHRNQNITGASMTKSFGSFTRGGELLYFPDDDGALEPRNLSEHGAVPMAIDTRECLSLFDEARAHGVQPFSGERYSLVFYTQQSFSNAPPASLESLRRLGAHMPDDASIRYYASLLAPAKGYIGGKQRSIQNCLFGHEDKPQLLQWKIASFNAMGSGALENSLSFVLCPTIMETVCAVSRKLERAAWLPSSWRGTLVGAAEPARPRGSRAHSHYRLWSLTAGVLVRQWQFRSCSFLVYSGYKPWQWRKAGNSIWYGWSNQWWFALSKNPVPCSNIKVLLDCPIGAPDLPFTFGIANTNSIFEIYAAHVQKQYVQTRGPEPAIDVQINVCSLTLCKHGCAIFEANTSAKRRRLNEPIGGTSLLLSFGVPQGRFEAQIGHTKLNETFVDWPLVIDVNALHFAFLAVKSKSRPTIVASPMLSLKD